MKYRELFEYQLYNCKFVIMVDKKLYRLVKKGDVNWCFTMKGFYGDLKSDFNVYSSCIKSTEPLLNKIDADANYSFITWHTNYNFGLNIKEQIV